MVDPITASYDTLLATDPTVPILFRLTSYRGQQVLFQDAACTIPVESIGDPIGGIRHPITGEIIAVQTVDASRPVWGGESVGAVFSGVEFLRVTVDAQIAPTSPGSMYVEADRQISTFAALFGWTNSSTQIGWLLAMTTQSRASVRYGVGGGGESAQDAYPAGRSVLAGSNNATQHSGFVNGSRVIGPINTGSQTPAAGIMPYLGARNDGNDGSEFHFVGSISSALVYSVFHDDATVQNVSGLIALEAA